ncbi:MAG: hypothetical protein M3040_13795 [Bacteroidota bacterium]|nr:hypothetical protein [Bacteroidota bacterium]
MNTPLFYFINSLCQQGKAAVSNSQGIKVKGNTIAKSVKTVVFLVEPMVGMRCFYPSSKQRNVLLQLFCATIPAVIVSTLPDAKTTQLCNRG